MSNLVGSQSRNTAVRQFAADVVASNIVGSTELKAAAKDAGIELPTKLDEVHQMRYEAFKEYKGADIDRDYMKAMTERRALAVKLFTRASKEAKNPTVKEFAAKKLPALQKHLETAKAIDK